MFDAFLQTAFIENILDVEINEIGFILYIVVFDSTEGKKIVNVCLMMWK